MRTINDMSTFEAARWMSLIEAVNVIADGCELNNKRFEDIKLEPLHIRKYIESTCDIKAREIEKEAAQEAEKLAHKLTTRRYNSHEVSC